MVLVSLASTIALNAVFDLGWPLWGPALFAAVALASVEAALWLTEKTGWILVGLTLVATVLGLWLKSRYGAMFSDPIHHWVEVTPSEVVTMLAATALAWYVAVIAVSRNRRGDRLPALGIVAWVERMLDAAPQLGQPFRTPAQAQTWFEWRKKGWAMPAIVLFGMVLGVGGWLIFSRDPTELLEGFIAGGGILSVAALVVGMMMGNCGRDDNFEFGQFLATRPMTSTDLARTILKTAAQSVFVGWALWAVAFAALYLTLVSTRLIPSPQMLRELPWWYAPVTLLGPWTIVAVGTAIGLSGRMKEFVMLLCGLFVLGIAWMSLIRNGVLLSDQAATQLAQGLVCTVGVALSLGTAWVFIAARRCALIGPSTVAAAASAWVAMTTILVFGWVLRPTEPLPALVFMIGALTLSVAPLAAAPLALAWNRTR
jgi:hypothetical protein